MSLMHFHFYLKIAVTFLAQGHRHVECMGWGQTTIFQMGRKPLYYLISHAFVIIDKTKVCKGVCVWVHMPEVSFV